MTPPRHLIVPALTALIALGTAVPAEARRAPTAKERRSIVRAVERMLEQGGGSVEVAGCSRVYVSTVAKGWASLESGRCLFTGVVVLRRRSGTWRRVASGSDLTCSVKGVPRRVVRDLRFAGDC